MIKNKPWFSPIGDVEKTCCEHCGRLFNQLYIDKNENEDAFRYYLMCTDCMQEDMYSNMKKMIKIERMFEVDDQNEQE